MFQSGLESPGQVNSAVHEITRFLNKHRGEGNTVLIETWQDKLVVKINPRYSQYGHAGAVMDILNRRNEN